MSIEILAIIASYMIQLLLLSNTNNLDNQLFKIFLSFLDGETQLGISDSNTWILSA